MWYLAIWIFFICVDVWFYAHARYPERARNFLYRFFPGGGIVAWWRFRK